MFKFIYTILCFDFNLVNGKILIDRNNVNFNAIRRASLKVITKKYNGGDGSMLDLSIA